MERFIEAVALFQEEATKFIAHAGIAKRSVGEPAAYLKSLQDLNASMQRLDVHRGELVKHHGLLEFFQFGRCCTALIEYLKSTTRLVGLTQAPDERWDEKAIKEAEQKVIDRLSDVFATSISAENSL